MTATLPGIVRMNAGFLLTGFEDSIRQSLLDAWYRAKPRKPQEPDVVAMLVLNGIGQFEKVLSFLLPSHGIRVNVSGVFCHQKPIVEFSGSGCELGDLLVVHRHTLRSGQITLRALLLQAKMASGSRVPVPSRDKKQLSLYTEWPSFVYSRAGNLNGRTRSILPKTAHSGAQYLLIDDLSSGVSVSGLLAIRGTHCMGVSPAHEILDTSTSFAYELVRMFEGSSGRSVHEDASTDSTGWSQVVWDLIEAAKLAVFKRRRVGIEGMPRSVGELAAQGDSGFFGEGVALLLGLKADDNTAHTSIEGRGDSPIKNYEEFDDDAGAVSVIVFETAAVE